MAKSKIKYTPIKFVLPIDSDSMQGKIIDYQIDSSNYLANYIIERLKADNPLFKLFIDRAYTMNNFGYALCKTAKEILKSFGTTTERRINKVKLNVSDINAVNAWEAIPSTHFEYIFKKIGNEIGAVITESKKEDISNFDSKYMHINWIYCKDSSELGSIYRYDTATKKFGIKVPKVDFIGGLPNLYENKLKPKTALPVGFILKNIDKDRRVSYVISLAAKDIDFTGNKTFEGEEVVSIVLSGPYANDTSIFYKSSDKSIEGVEGYDKTVISLNLYCVHDFDEIFENKKFRYMNIKGNIHIQAYIESILSSLITLNPKNIILTSILTDYDDLYAPTLTGYSISRNFYMMIENAINRFAVEYDINVTIVEAMDPELKLCTSCKKELTERCGTTTLFSRLRFCRSSCDCERAECLSGCGLSLELVNHLGIRLLQLHSKDTAYY